MEKSRLHHVEEIDEYVEQLENALRNFTFLAAGEVTPDEVSELSLKDLANISLLREDLKELKEDLTAEPDGCQDCNKKNYEIQSLEENIKYLKQLKNLQNEKIDKHEKQLGQSGNQQEPQKMQVCK